MSAPDTAGTRLARQAGALMERRLHRPGWTRTVAPVLARAAARPQSATRFARVEQAAGLPPLPGVPPPVFGLPRPEPLGATVREALPAELGTATAAMRVHRGPQVDARLSEAGADAITAGTDTAIRDGAFRPHEPSGAALIAHEAAHVMAGTAPGAAWRRATAAGRAEEERWALRVEHTVSADRSGALPPAGPRPWAAPQDAPWPAAPPSTPSIDPVARTGSLTDPSAPPMTALVGRDDTAEPPAPRPAPTAAVPALTDAAYRELLHRLRVELERGG